MAIFQIYERNKKYRKALYSPQCMRYKPGKLLPDTVIHFFQKSWRIQMTVQNIPTADSPATDPLESIFATYYELNGYIVSSNKWFWFKADKKKQPGYQDIDVLAIAESETIIASVTACLDDKIRFNNKGEIRQDMLDKLVSYFERCESYLKSTQQYAWVLSQNRTPKRILAYGFAGKSFQKLNPFLKEHNIELFKSTNAINDIKDKVIKLSATGLRTNNQLIKLIQHLPSE